MFTAVQKSLILLLTFAISATTLSAQEKPLKALMITGGCCHDYAKQKDIISKGISARVATDWTIFFDNDAKKSKEYLSQDDWAAGYDFILYNHCFAHETDAAFIDAIASQHQDGLPAIALLGTLSSGACEAAKRASTALSSGAPSP